MPYSLLFSRLVLRPLRTEPVRTSLTVLAVALGVAVVIAIELAGEAAAGSFRSSVETLAGGADWEVSVTGGVPPETLTKLARLPVDLKLRPRIEDYAVLNGATVPLIGVDVLSDAPAERSGADTEPNFRENAVWVTEGLGFKAGQELAAVVNDAEVRFIVRGTLRTGSGDALITDLSTATRVLRRDGRLDRILISGGTPEVFAAAGIAVAPYGTRTDENRKMLAAFRWNLRVLSYVALVVGAFLIYNTISVSVVRRRAEIGIVRAVGATRLHVLGAFLGEALCFGIVGGLAGILLGRLLAAGAVGAVAATVQSLYVSSRPGAIELTAGVAAIGLVLASGISLLSALAPAWEAAQVSPIEAMARGRREHVVRTAHWRNLGIAAALALGALIASRQSPVAGKPLFGYAATLLAIGAASFAIPPLVSVLARVRLGLPGVELLLATRSLAGSLRRTSVLAGALATAIAMTAAVGIMVGSFRETVLLWMDDRLKADLYLRPATPAGADRHPTLAPDTADRLRGLASVEAVDAFRAYEITYNGQPATLAGGETSIAMKHGRRALLSGDASEIAGGGDVALVSEPFANKHGVRTGDTLQLQIGQRAASLRVTGVYFDYASERGYILLDRRTLLRYLPDPAPSNVAVYLRSGVSLEDGRRQVESALQGRRVVVLTNRTLRSEAIAIFDRTFAITYALEGVAVAVAVMGVAGALLALVIDRRRELSLLRFLGGSTDQIRRLILFEAGLLGLLANAIGLVLGFVLSLLLIFVINKQSFGWTIQFHWPVAVLIGALSLIYAATVASALYPARVAARLNPIEAIHEE